MILTKHTVQFSVKAQLSDSVCDQISRDIEQILEAQAVIMCKSLKAIYGVEIHAHVEAQ